MASDVHTITLDSNGGLPEQYTISVTTGEQVGALPANPKRSGYTFVKWKRCNADGEI